MGYMHISNLYKKTDILMMKECYALEKIHGTSAWLTIEDGKIQYHSGGTKHETFVGLFDEEHLLKVYNEQFTGKVIINGESYGGKEQGMSHTYGPVPKFVVFDVRINDVWLNVPNAENVAAKFNLDFVDYCKIPTTLEMINYQRDRSSVQSIKNGITEEKLREGVVLRPIEELIKPNGSRLIVKHKRAEFCETKTPREVDPARLVRLEEASAIAEEWVTPMRLNHVLDKFPEPYKIEDTGKIVKAMVEDVLRESTHEIVISDEAKSAIAKKASELFRKLIFV